jgi:hypothetical protein
MQTNPNIILSGNQMAAPQLPDVNAMMQTRTAGMENIYGIEQQRAAQAQAAQKEQEAALVDALAPAYATAFKGRGSKEALTAAYNLLPPEIQPGVKGQIDKLMAMPSDDLRLSALEASLAGSDAGRTLLTRIMTPYQEGMLGIQRGQQDIAQQRLAMDAAAAEREAAGVGQPKVAFRETDAEGNVRMYDAAGNELGMLPKAGKPTAPAGGGVKPEAAAKADDTLGKIMAAYDKLRDLKAITSTNQTAVENLKATASAKTGSTLGAAVGSEAQTQRQIIKNLRQALLNDIKAATGMSSKAIDSNVELQAFLNSLGDPENQSYEAAITTIGELSSKYAGGALSGRAQDVLKGKTDLQPPPAGTATGRIPQISSDEEYDMLPSGAVYIDPNGQQRTKR